LSEHVLPQISVVIPTLNESKNLPHVFGLLDAVDVAEVIVVDGGSVDDTVATAQALRPDVRVVEQGRRGKGNALACGFAAARGDVLVALDADGSADPAEIPAFLAQLESGADFAKGTRFADAGGSADLTGIRKLGNAALSRLANQLFGCHYTDLCYGYNAFWKEQLPSLGLNAAGDDDNTRPQWGDGFEIETLINVRAAARGLAVAEVPSFEHRRIHGDSNLNAVTDGLRVLRTLLFEARVARMSRIRSRLSRARRKTGPPLPAADADNAGEDSTIADPSTAILPSVSVVIAAFADERWDDLAEAVESVARQTPSALETIVVIDHNPGLLARAREELDGVRVVPNAGDRGASGARNTGAGLASGDVIAFLDDDAVADPEWLEQIRRPFADPRVVGSGGALRPIWHWKRPRWFPSEFDWVVGASYRGMPHRTARVRNVWSGNMALRRSVFVEIDGFRTGFGKAGKRSRPEDTDLCLRAADVAPDAGWVYQPTARAGHKVPPERSRWRFFLSRCYSEGRGKAELAALVGTRRSTSTERGYAGRVVTAGVVRHLGQVVKGDMAGFGRAAAIAAGLGAAAAGLTAAASDTLRRHTAAAAPADTDAAVADSPAKLSAVDGHAHRRAEADPVRKLWAVNTKGPTTSTSAGFENGKSAEHDDDGAALPRWGT
jgi:glycosyltransferase involved in cell wall biosynthesis